MVPVVIVFGGIGSAGLGAVILRIADALLILALLQGEVGARVFFGVTDVEDAGGEAELVRGLAGARNSHQKKPYQH